MISIPDYSYEAGAALTPWQCLLRGLPRAYAILFFSPSRRLGWMLLCISLLTPEIGLSGVAGVLLAGGLAMALGFDRSAVRNGFILFNPLLVCLTLGLMNRAYQFPPPLFLALWLAAVLGGLFLSIAMQKWMGQQFSLSPQSIPATILAYALTFLAVSIAGHALPPLREMNPWLDLYMLPQFARSFFETFGAMMFQPRVLPGILVFLALASVSPLAALTAVCSFATGVGTLMLLGYPVDPDNVVWCGFNFLLCGIALGTAYFAPSRKSLALAMGGTFLVALVAVALSGPLRQFGLPASALPYNLVVLTLVFALRQRREAAGLHPSPAPGMLPETAGRFVVLDAHRFPHLNVPALSLPLKEECIITQGVDGKTTHRAPWNWALDFEISRNGRRWIALGHELEDYHIFDKTVLAPCDGTVVAAVSHVHDNAPGSNNPADNWGNYVVIYNEAGYHVLLGHLRQGTLLVFNGQRLYCGQPIARCGNSGRSPIPHLHMQVQDAPYPGGATRPFCLRHYVETDEAAATQRYTTSGVPAEGARLTWPVPLPALHQLFSDWLPGEYRYRTTTEDGRNREETILVDFDEMGRFRLRSLRYSAQLTAFISNQVFYTTDYDGVGESVLAHFAVALARVPCIADPGAEWSDFASPVPFHRGFFRGVHGLADPFIGAGLLEYRYGLEAGDQGYVVHSRLKSPKDTHRPSHTPQRLHASLIPRFGVGHLEVRLWNDTTMSIELIDPPVRKALRKNSEPSLEAASNFAATAASLIS
ncbi:MAG: urea transporter [Candidatus Methylacidiphilales bacterium]|nr:urea transporter [Candidatus Methylacidiphilales bacterium]